jgi:hypothetical protein
MDHFADCVLNDKQSWTPGEEGLADARVIEAIERSIESGKREKVESAERQPSARDPYVPLLSPVHRGEFG